MATGVHVFVEWEGRGHPLGRVARRRQRVLNQLRPAKERTGPDLSDAGGCADGCIPTPDLLDELAALAAILFALAFLIWLTPIVAAAALWLVLVVVLSLVLVVSAAWRTILYRPWRVVALSDTERVWVWHQVGWRNARRLVTEIEAAVEAGHAPQEVAVDRLDPASPINLVDVAPTLLDHPILIWVSRIVVIVVGLVAAVFAAMRFL